VWLKDRKNSPIFGNVAKIVAKILKLNLKYQNCDIKSCLNVKISTANHVLKQLILGENVKNAQVQRSQMAKFCPIW
jgi:hypothetical protein